MPAARIAVTLAIWCAAACSPSEFAWEERDELARYRAAFHSAAGTRLEESMDREELLRHIGRQRVLWLGDHHRSVRVHELQLQLLGELQQRRVPLLLCVEAVGEQDMGAVNRYLRGESTLDELRSTMRQRWPGSWLDDEELDAAHYRRLLTFARRHGLSVLPLEPTPRPPLAQRDASIAAAVRAAAQHFPDRLIVVQVGQAHLLGEGGVVARTGLGGFVLGAEPPDTLRAAALPDAPGDVLRSDGGIWWFREVLTAAPVDS